MGEARRRKLAAAVRAEAVIALDKLLDVQISDAYRISLPDVLYHYTTWAGAEGILSTREIWATAHDCTNDKAELTSVDDTILDVVRTMAGQLSGVENRLLERFLADYGQSRVSLNLPTYIACFSTSKDDPEIWRREYADAGAGLCLGFRMLSGESEPTIDGVGRGFILVDYSEESWRTKLEEHFGMVLAAVRNRDLDTADVKLVLVALNRIAAFAAIQGKQPQWAAEKELRSVAVLGRNSTLTPKERESRGKLVRYLPLPMRSGGRLPVIDEIIVGPMQDGQNARLRLDCLLRNHGYAADDSAWPRITMSGVSPW